MGSEWKISHLEHVEGQRPNTTACANLQSGSLQGTTVPFGTAALEAPHQKITSKERKAIKDCSSSTEGATIAPIGSAPREGSAFVHSGPGVL